MEKKSDFKMLSTAMLILAALAVTSGLYLEEMDSQMGQTPYKRALRQAAVLADSWGSQSALLHTLTKDLDPEVIPSRPKRSILTSSGRFAQDLRSMDEGHYFDDMFYDEASVSYFANVSMQAKEPEILSCLGDGSNSTIHGYCKEDSICESFGGTAVGLCWKDGDTTAVCCQPTPGRFFPIPYLYEPEMDMRRLKRGADGDNVARTALTEAGNFLKSMGERADGRRQRDRSGFSDHIAKYYHKRLYASPDSLAANYDLLKIYAAAHYLMKKKGVSSSTALSILASSTEGNKLLESHCPATPKCDACYPYYSFDGICNNIEKPLWGKAEGYMLRLLPANYADDLWATSHGYKGQYLGSPRAIATNVYSLEGGHEKAWSMWIMTYGQFITHDLARALELRSYPKGDIISCCKADFSGPLAKDQLHLGCYPIDVPKDDPWYGKHKVRCLSAVRSIVTVHPDCYIPAGQHTNGPTAFLDASVVYGNDEKAANKIRAFKNGLLLSKCIKGGLKCSKDLNPADDPTACPIEKQILPTVIPDCTTDCEFIAGDDRVNENPSLVALHVIFLRYHNRVALELAKLNPHWDDEKLYQEARKIVIAQYQFITYYEYLKIQFGSAVLARYSKKLDTSRKDFTSDYNPKVQPGLLYEFATSAFRMGHSQCLEEFWMPDKWSFDLAQMNRTARKIDLVDHYNKCQGCCDQTFLEALIRGLSSQETYAVDSGMELSIHGQLFKPAKLEYGHDLTALDMMRGRDHGMPYYPKYLKYCHIGKKAIRTWEDLKGIMEPDKIAILKKLYFDVAYTELYTAGFVETIRTRDKRDKDFMGPTFVCLLLESFLRLKISDRFWFSEKNRPEAFTSKQLHEIYERGGLSRIICNVFPNIEKFPSNPFLVPLQTGNPLVACKDLPTVDLTKWKERVPKKVSGGVCTFYKNGKRDQGTCLPKELCEKGSGGSHEGDQCGSSSLKCCVGLETVLNSHIDYSEPTDHELAKFFALTPGGIVFGNAQVNGPNRLRDAEAKLAEDYEKHPASEKYSLTEPFFATETEREMLFSSIVAQQAFKKILEKLKEQGKAVSASVFYGVKWSEVHSETCLENVICEWHHPYRTPNGVCNYQANPEAGVATGSQPLIIPANSYADGLGAFPIGQNSLPMPNARAISLHLFKRESSEDQSRTLLLPYLVHFLHSEIFQPVLFEGMSPLECCTASGSVVLSPAFGNKPLPGCSPVEVGDKDPLFGSEHIRCLPVQKNPPGAPIQCTVQPNSPLNRATGWLSLSLVYGTTVTDEDRVRAHENGLLKLETKSGDKLPVLTDSRYRTELFGSSCGTSWLCRRVAAPIVNRYAELLPWVILFAREHNRIAKSIQHLNPHWSDEEIFHEAKAINIGQWQAIVLKEVIPALIGVGNTKYLRITLDDVAYNAKAYVKHDAFGAADTGGEQVLRAIYLNTIKPIAQVYDYDGKHSSSYSTVSSRSPIFLLTPDLSGNSKAVDLFFQTLLQQHAERFDNRVFKESQGIFKFTHKGRSAKIGFDQLAESIQISREDGLAFYNDLRKACGFASARKFSNLQDTIKYWEDLSEKYKSPKDVDGLVGILLEGQYPQGNDSILGGVGVCLLANMVRDWMTKDRYFFSHPDNPRKFTSAQIHAISQRTMAGILCDNTEYIDAARKGYFSEFPKNVFFKSSTSNPILSCKTIPSLKLELWRNSGSIVAKKQDDLKKNCKVNHDQQHHEEKKDYKHDDKEEEEEEEEDYHDDDEEYVEEEEHDEEDA